MTNNDAIDRVQFDRLKLGTKVTIVLPKTDRFGPTFLDQSKHFFSGVFQITLDYNLEV